MSGHACEKHFVVVAETRRRWSGLEKQAMVAEAGKSSVSSVARKHGIAASLLFRWRRELEGNGTAAEASPERAFIPVALAAPVVRQEAESGGAGVMEIVLSGNRRIIVGRDVDAAALRQVIAVL